MSRQALSCFGLSLCACFTSVKYLNSVVSPHGKHQFSCDEMTITHIVFTYITLYVCLILLVLIIPESVSGLIFFCIFGSFYPKSGYEHLGTASAMVGAVKIARIRQSMTVQGDDVTTDDEKEIPIQLNIPGLTMNFENDWILGEQCTITLFIYDGNRSRYVRITRCEEKK